MPLIHRHKCPDCNQMHTASIAPTNLRDRMQISAWVSPSELKGWDLHIMLGDRYICLGMLAAEHLAAIDLAIAGQLEREQAHFQHTLGTLG